MKKTLVINKRPIRGYLHHYAHFLQDCLFPEVVHLQNYQFQLIYRKHTKVNHLGFLQQIYEKVLGVKVKYLENEEFEQMEKKINKMITKGFHWTLYNIPNSISKFQRHVFKTIDLFNLDFPKYDIILIERGVKKLIKDSEFESHETKTGSQRRKIKNINQLEAFIKRICDGRDMTYIRVQLEHIPFEEQVYLFHHAKMIVGIHGAGLSNLFFCKKYTKVVEIKPIISNYFSDISKSLSLIYRQPKNTLESIKYAIQQLLLINITQR